MAKDLRNKGSFPLVKDEGDPSSTSIAKDPQTAIYDPSVKDSMLRKGKWTTEEEDYATKIISLFNRGLLHIGAGTTLRSYLSDKLHCDPMRITKKFAGASCIGKQVYQPSDDLFTGENSQIEIEELGVLENSFYRRVGDRSGHGDEGDCPTSVAASSTSSSSSMKASNGVKSQNMNVKWNRDECQADTLYSSSSSKYRAEFIDSEGLKREKRPGGMRSVASAPDFSQLRRMHDTKATENIQLKVHKRSITGGSFKRNQRSHSVMNFIDFERYVSDDSAAVDLLLQFASKMDKTQLDDRASDDDSYGGYSNSGPVTKFLRLDSLGSWKGSGQPSNSMLVNSTDHCNGSRIISPHERNKDIKIEGGRKVEDESDNYDRGINVSDINHEDDDSIIVDQSMHRISSVASLARTYEDDQYDCYDNEEESEPSIGLSLT